jgi:Bacterial Ig-like domain (group 3)
VSQTVNKTPTTTGLNSDANPSKAGQTVTFTATVFNDSGGSPSGIVNFLDGVSVLGTPSLRGGLATLKVSSLSSGPHDITASYGGDANFVGSTSPVLVQTVAGLVTPTVVLTVQPSTANAGDTVTFTATVSYPGGPVPTGSVTISDVTNGTKIYGIASLKKGVAVAKNSTIPPGSYNIVATYGGDGGSHYNGAQSDSVPLRIVGGSRPNPGIATSGAPND